MISTLTAAARKVLELIFVLKTNGSSWYVYLASLLCSGCWFGNFNLTTVTTTDHHFYISISVFLHCLPLLSQYDLSVIVNVQDLVNKN